LTLRRRIGLNLLLLLIGIAAVFGGIDWYQHRFVRSDTDLLKLLPGDDATVFFARVGLLRRAGMLGLVRNTGERRDSDYEAFVRETGFDYWKNLDAAAGSIQENAALMVARGRFDWDRIRVYVRRQGGVCANDHCELPSSSAGKWIGIVRIQRDVLGVALGNQRALTAQIHPGQKALAGALSAYPVWVKIAPHLVRDPASVPAALRIFLISLQPAASVVIALGPARDENKNAFDIELSALCNSAVAADTVRKQLEIQTNMLKLELAREHQKPNPADLTGLLTAGVFDTSGKEVRGEWPVTKELLKTLQ
jgi:hypothetical protein